jgi:pheromone shutdown-related protein TraB
MQANTYIKPEITEISQNIHLLTFKNEKKLYLIGTAHVSADSVTLVEETINKYSPDTICVELDEQRYQNMLKKNIFEDLDIIQIIKKKQLFFFIGQFMMASFQKKISEKTGSKPGEEFRKAITLADENSLNLVLADRNIGTTLKRAWRLTPFKDKFKFLGSLLVSDDDDLEDLDIEKMKSMDAINNLIENFADGLPITKEVLIDERDTFLAYEIQNNLGEITVAVVGAGHVPGILRKLKSKIPQEEKEKINIIPPPKLIGKIIPWIIPGIITTVFVLGFIYGDKKVAKDVIIYWIMANGILTSIGCILAFSHPLTIITGFIAAPITSLNPTIGAGFVTAIVQTLVSKPRIKDFEQLKGKSMKIRDWWSNRITKIFLVFFLSSIGSSIGTFVALPALTKFFKG